MKLHPSCYSSAILKKLAVFQRKVGLILLQLGCSKEEERLHVGGSFNRAVWKMWHWGNRVWLAHSHPLSRGHLPPGKGHLPLTQDVLQPILLSNLEATTIPLYLLQ